MSGISDSDLDGILARQAQRIDTVKPGLKHSDHPDFMALRSILEEFLDQRRINRGNVYGDELASFLLDHGVVRAMDASKQAQASPSSIVL